MLGHETYTNHSHFQHIFCHMDVLGEYVNGKIYFPKHNSLFDMRI
jgi:hypothetical protein